MRLSLELDISLNEKFLHLTKEKQKIHPEKGRIDRIILPSFGNPATMFI